jgi:hypothetical protein
MKEISRTIRHDFLYHHWDIWPGHEFGDSYVIGTYTKQQLELGRILTIISGHMGRFHFDNM